MPSLEECRRILTKYGYSDTEIQELITSLNLIVSEVLDKVFERGDTVEKDIYVKEETEIKENRS